MPISRKLLPVAFTTALMGSMLALSGAAPANAAGQVTFSVDAPTVQGSFVDGVVVETFNDGCNNPLPFGTFRGQCWGNAANYYAGASTTSSTPTTGGAGTDFVNIPMGGAINFRLDAPARYLGFHWEAGNEFDRVRLYSGDTLIADFSFQTLMDALEQTEFESADGESTYTVADYYGNPVTGQQLGEPYAFVHIFASEGVTFDRVYFSEDDASVGFFEFDNMSILFDSEDTITDNTFDDVVELTSVTVRSSNENLAQTGAELPNGVFIASLGLLGVAVFLRRRIARN
jgi:hypothetical protein